MEEFDRTHSLNGVSRRATAAAFEHLSKTAFVAILTQLVAFPAVTFTAAELRSTPFPWIGSIGIAIVAVLRFAQLKFGARVFQTRHGLLISRLWYGIGVQWLAFSWTGISCYAVWFTGISSVSFRMIAVLLASVAWTATAFTFDLWNNAATQCMYLLPLAVVVGLRIHPVFGLVLVAYLLFALRTTRAIHRTEIELVTKSELLEEQFARLGQSHHFINAMLESIDESFVMLDANGVCTGSASQVSRAFFGVETNGVEFVELLGLTGGEAEKARKWYRALFADQLDFHELAAKGPKLVEVAGGSKVLRLKYHPKRDEQGRLTAVIFTASDVTREIQVQRSLDEERERASLIVRITENRAGFRLFLADLETALKRMKAWDGGDFAQIKRDLHTLKGAAMLLGAPTLANHIYKAELAIGSDGAASSEKVREQGLGLYRFFSLWRRKEISLFTQLGVYEGDLIEISRDKLRALESDYSAQGEVLEHFKIFMGKIIATDFGDYLRDFAFQVRNAAVKLGKKVRYEVIEPGYAIPADPATYRECVRALVHLFNNAVDHGLESPEERSSAGKPEEGRITVRYSRIESGQRPYIHITIEDDGRGIDIAKLRERLRAGGRKDVEKMTDLEVASTIFSSGLSTRDSVTELSGQGVGMGAVKSAVLKVRGKISVSRTGAGGTQFDILIPEKKTELTIESSQVA